MFAYWCSIFLVGIAFLLLRAVSKSFILPAVLGRGYKDATNAKKQEMGESVCALVFSLISGPIGAYLFFFDTNLNENLDSFSTKASLTFIFSAGYFLWDMFDSSIFFKPQFLAHAVLAFLTFNSFVFPKVQSQYFGCAALMYELSTPFYNLRQFLVWANQGHTKLFQVTEKLFAISFIAVRICFGLPLSAIWFYQVYWTWTSNEPAASMTRDIISWPAVGVSMTANILLNLMNIVWGYKGILMLFGHGKHAKSKQQAQHTGLPT